jgi:hypothetical protein
MTVDFFVSALVERRYTLFVASEYFASAAQTNRRFDPDDAGHRGVAGKFS